MNKNTEGSFQVKKTKCPTLKPHEEEKIVQFISEKAKKGEPVLRQDIIDLVVKFIKSDNRRNPFRDGIPGDKWFSLFRRRHNDCFIQFQPKVLKALESVGFSEKVLNTIFYKTPPATANGVRNAYLPRKRRKGNTSQSPTPAMPSPTVSEESCQVSVSDDMETSRGQESQRDTLDFRIGSKLEVMDFNEKWHPVKVVEVDYDEGEIMVHFETLSDRNYEWLPMDSNRIRQPMLPAVPTKEVFTVDEKVIAVWSYKRKYTATVREVLPDDNYEVLFYDGYAKTLPGCKLFKATEEDQQNIMEYSCDEDPLKEEKVNFVIKQENFCEKDPLKEEEQVKDEIKQEIPEGHLFPVIRLERNREIEEAVLEMLKLEEEEYSCNEDDPLEEETVKYEITQENSSDDDPLGFSEFEEEQVKYETTQDISCDEDPLEEKQVKFEIKQIPIDSVNSPTVPYDSFVQSAMVGVTPLEVMEEALKFPPIISNENTPCFVYETVCTELVAENLDESSVTIVEDINLKEFGPLKDQRKRNACFYCKDMVSCSNYARHLLRNHKDKGEVKKLSCLPKKSEERRAILNDLKNKGNFVFNSNSEVKQFIPARRPLKDQSPKKKDFVSCSFCLLLVKRKNLFLHRKICNKFSGNIKQCKYCHSSMKEGFMKKHLKTCEKKTDCKSDDEKSESKRQIRVLQSSSICPTINVSGVSDDFIENILPIIRLDEIGDFVRNDQLILRVGSKLRNNLKEFQDKVRISSKVRGLAKLVFEMKKNNSIIQNLKDCLRAENSKLLLSAVKSISGYDESTGSLRVPSVPARLKSSIYLALEIVMKDIRTDPNISSESKKEAIFNFQTTEDLIRSDWKHTISTHVKKAENETHHNKVLMIPLEEDIKTMSAYLSEQETMLYDQLKDTSTPQTYEQLCKALIGDLIICNCRRAGEVTRATLKDYLSRNDIKFKDNLEEMLSKKELAEKGSLTMFCVPGKRGRNVPILLTDTMKKCIELIVTLRDEVQVSENPLLFPRVLSERPYDSYKIIRELKQRVPLKEPDRFTTTGLRHEAASHSKARNGGGTGHSAPECKQTDTEKLIDIGVYTDAEGLHDIVVNTAESEKHSQVSSNEIDPDYNPKNCEKNTPSSSDNDSENESKRPSQRIRKRWSYEEQNVVIAAFQNYIKTKTRPGKLLCEKLIASNKCLSHRNWMHVNIFIDNILRGKRKLIPEFAHLLAR